MNRRLLKAFWNCGDSDIIDYAMARARLNKNEKQVLLLTFDECLTQEDIAEDMFLSLRRVQELFYDASRKMLAIPWVKAYARELEGE